MEYDRCLRINLCYLLSCDSLINYLEFCDCFVKSAKNRQVRIDVKSAF